ncbi:thioredoxin family protein [Reichenbachiella sp.]
MIGSRTIIIWVIAPLLFPFLTYSQPNVYTFDQLDSLQQISKRKLVVFIHTDWCKYCEAMENTSFRNKEVARKLNDSFWFIKLNAESKEDIGFSGRVFRFKPSGVDTGTHELAKELGTQHGKLSYPSLCILNPNYQILFQYDQFLSADQLLEILEGI